MMGLLVVNTDEGGVVVEDELGAEDNVCASYLLLNDVTDEFCLLVGYDGWCSCWRTMKQ